MIYDDVDDDQNLKKRHVKVRHPDPRLWYGRPGQLEEAGQSETAQQQIRQITPSLHSKIPA